MTLLPSRRLPGLGREVSAVGAGCWPLGGPASNNGTPIGWGPVDDQQVQQTLRAAYEAGVTVYDTADVYGHGCAMRRSVISPAQRGEIGGVSLDPLAYPAPKGNIGDKSMPGN